jgi:hypothetical protein
VLQSNFDELGITPAIFTEFRDKEYVQRIQNRMGSIIAKSRRDLTERQIVEAEECWIAIAQMPFLDQAIEAVSAKEFLVATQDEWEELGRKVKLRTRYQVLAIVGLVVLAMILPSVFTVSAMITGAIGDDWLTLLLQGSASIALLAGIALFIFFLVKASKVVPPRYEELQGQRHEQQTKLMSQEEWNEIVRIVGARTNDSYRKLRAKRLEFIRSVIGQTSDFERFVPTNGHTHIVDVSAKHTNS